MNKTAYTLLIANDRNCADCDSKAIYILLGTENEFLGFYCSFHGIKLKERLEGKYRFQSENKWEPIKKKSIKRYKLKSDKEQKIDFKIATKHVRQSIKEQKKHNRKQMMKDILNEILETGARNISNKDDE